MLATTLLQMFCEIILYFQVIIKDSFDADGRVKKALKHEWVKFIEKYHHALT